MRVLVFLLRVAAGPGGGNRGMEMVLSVILWIVGVLYLLDWLQPVASALDGVGTQVGETRFSLLGAIKLLVDGKPLIEANGQLQPMLVNDRVDAPRGKTIPAMIEVFHEVARDRKAVDDCQTWLLKQKQTQQRVKTVKFRPKTEEHDYAFKKKHIIEFLDEGAKVKVVVMFRGREMAYVELGERIIQRLLEDLKDVIVVDFKAVSAPKNASKNCCCPSGEPPRVCALVWPEASSTMGLSPARSIMVSKSWVAARSAGSVSSATVSRALRAWAEV